MSKSVVGSVFACLILMAVAVSLTAGFAFAGEPVDGTMWLGAPGPTLDMKYSDGQYWYGYQPAGNGGVAAFSATSFCNIAFPASLTLRGLDFLEGYQADESAFFKGEYVTMSGDAFVRSATDVARGIRLGVALKGTGDNTLTKKGKGRLLALKNFSNFGKLKVADGVLEQTAATDGRIFGDASVKALEIGAGEAKFVPPSAGLSVRLPGKLIAGQGGGLLPLNNGVKMTAGSLEVAEGAALVITNQSNVAGLGTTETLTFDTAPTLVSGIVDPRVVTRDTSVMGGPFSFLTYDVTKGLVAYEPTKTLDEADETDIASVTPASVGAGVEIGEDRHVAGLVVNNRANLLIAEGKTLTVGDGTHPAGVIFREQELATTYSQYASTGWLDFASSHGVIWKGAPGTANSCGRGLDVKGPIAGSNGITFASRSLPGVKESGALIRLYVPAQWTGPTYAHNVRLWPYVNAAFPPGGDVWLCGAERAGSAGLFLQGNFALDQKFHFMGRLSVDGSAVLQASGKITYSGALDFVDDARISIAQTNTISGALTGCGNIDVYRAPQDASAVLGRIVTTGATDGYSGRISLKSADLTWVVGEGSQLPTNTFDVGGGALEIENHRTSVSHVIGTGVIRTSQSELNFTGPTDFAGTFEVDADTKTNLCSTIGVGPAVRFGAVNAVNGGGTGKFVALTADSELTLGNDASDVIFRPSLQDGAAGNRLSLVKDGTDTLTLVGKNDYSGKTVVKKGTLRLRGNPLESPSISFWLDATKESTVLRDATGHVTNWVSLVKGVQFIRRDNDSSYQYPKSGAKLNGLNVLTFGSENGPSGLIANMATEQRTVFVVYRRAGAPWNDKFSELFGQAWTDKGIRANSSGSIERNVSSSKFNTLGYVYNDGVKKTANFAANSTDAGVLVCQHDADWIKGDSASYGSVPSTFTFEIGGYNNGNGCWNGDIAEVIAFDRLLTDAERQTVENYLGEKWRGETLYPNVAAEQCLSSATALEIADGATLDLAGADQTVASLEGMGTITNSSSRPATLTVTGACSFAGKLVGNVKLAANGGGDKALRLDLRDEASLAIQGGVSSLVTYTNTPSTEGLAYWLDASDASSVQCSTDGHVTNWVSRAGTVSAFYGTAVASGGITGPAAYTTAAEGIGGLRTICFNANGQALYGRSAAIVRTVFFVFENLKTSSMGAGGYWGKNGCDRGIRCNGTTTQFQSGGRVTYYLKEDTVRYNATAYDLFSQTLTPGKTPFCFVVRLDEAAHPDDEIQYGGSVKVLQFADRFGCYAGTGNGNTNFKVGEVIAYSRTLSDAEMLAVEKYLMDKWSLAGHTPVVAPATPFNGTGSLELSGGATVAGPVDLEQGSLVVHVLADGTVDTVNINGALKVGANVTLVVDGVDRAARGTYQVLSVTGGVTGDFASLSAVPGRRWQVYRNGDTWYLAKLGLMVIVR